MSPAGEEANSGEIQFRIPVTLAEDWRRREHEFMPSVVWEGSQVQILELRSYWGFDCFVFLRFVFLTGRGCGVPLLA